jgi:transposase
LLGSPSLSLFGDLARAITPCPDFNPIENAFAKLEALLRKAAERTIERLWAAIGELLVDFTPSQRANMFAAAGYEPN